MVQLRGCLLLVLRNGLVACQTFVSCAGKRGEEKKSRRYSETIPKIPPRRCHNPNMQKAGTVRNS